MTLMKNDIKQIMENTQKASWSLKWKVYFILFLIIVGAGIYGYFWLIKTMDLRAEAEKSVMHAKYYDTLRSSIEFEWNRCNVFIAQEQGDFGSFEYCKKFINWADGLSLPQ
jgi:hypothetical protein